MSRISRLSEVTAAAEAGDIAMPSLIGAATIEERIRGFGESIDGDQEEKSEIDYERQQIIDEIPNGGWFAWMQVLGSAIMYFNSWYDYIFYC